MRITNYILLFTTLFCLNLYGGSERLVEKANYEISYEQALQKAQELNKPLMMVVGQSECPWCSKFYVKTLTKKTINKKVQQNFIPLTVLRDKDIFPKKFKPEAVPTVYFIDPKEEESFYKSFGYKSKREYKIEIEIENAIDLFNKKYKL